MSVISLKLKNISARIPPLLFSPFFSKEDIKQLLLKKFFHYNVSHDAILATRSYKIDSFSIVNFPLIIDPRFVFSFHSRYRYEFASPKILQTRKSTIIADTKSKSLPQLVQLNAKWTKPLNASTPRLNCGGSKEREREFIHLVFATKILVSRSVLAHSGSDAFAKCFPSPAAKIVEHEYLAFGRKISPWTCTINDPPLFLLNRWIRTPLSIRRRVGESELPLELFSRGKTPRKWILERGEEGEKGVDKCKTRCRKRSNRFRTFLVILYLVKFGDIKSCDISSLTNVTFEASTRFDRYLARAIRLFPSRGIRD